MKLGGWLILAAVIAGVAQAKPRAPVPPADVTAAVQQLVLDAWPKADPDDPEDHPPVMPPLNTRTIVAWLKAGTLRPVKISPGKGSDWLIDTGKLDNLAAYFCGTGGCEQQLWSPDESGHYSKVFDSQVREMRFHWIKGKAYTWIEVDYHGAYCGTFGAAACPWAYEWRGQGLGVSWRFAHGDVMRPGGLISPLDDNSANERVSMPAALQARLAEQEAACKAKDAEFDHSGAVNSMPDLNGDGIEDWSYDGAAGYCSRDNTAIAGDDTPCTTSDCVTTIWLSRRDNNSGAAWDQVSISPKGLLGWRYHKASGRADLIELDNLPGVPDGSDQACDTYALSQCAEVVIPLSPRP